MEALLTSTVGIWDVLPAGSGTEPVLSVKQPPRTNAVRNLTRYLLRPARLGLAAIGGSAGGVILSRES